MHATKIDLVILAMIVAGCLFLWFQFFPFRKKGGSDERMD
jgi:hypothetical protein